MRARSVLLLLLALSIAGCSEGPSPEADAVQTAASEPLRDALVDTTATEATSAQLWNLTASISSTASVAVAAGSESISVDGCQILTMRIPDNATEAVWSFTHEPLSTEGVGDFEATLYPPEGEVRALGDAAVAIVSPVRGEWTLTVKAAPAAVHQTYSATVVVTGSGPEPQLSWGTPVECTANR